MSTITELLDANARTATALSARAIEIATEEGLDTTSWRAGDPTRVMLLFLVDVLANDALVSREAIKAGFLSEAEGDWKTIVASEVYGKDRVLGSYASPTVTVTNSGQGYYAPEAGDLTFSSTTSGKTYHSVSGGSLTPGETLTIELEADELGSDSTVAENEIDAFVTPLIGVEIVSSTASIGIDEQDDPGLDTAAMATLGLLSPNGPPDAAEAVALSTELTGVSTVTKAHADPDGTDHEYTVYVAGPDGPVSGADLSAVQAAEDQWATPIGFLVTAVNATSVPVNVTATVSGTNMPAGFAADAEAAVEALFPPNPIGGVFSRAMIVHALYALAVAGKATNVAVNVVAPAADVVLGESENAAAGTVGVSVV